MLVYNSSILQVLSHKSTYMYVRTYEHTYVHSIMYARTYLIAIPTYIHVICTVHKVYMYVHIRTVLLSLPCAFYGCICTYSHKEILIGYTYVLIVKK